MLSSNCANFAWRGAGHLTLVRSCARAINICALSLLTPLHCSCFTSCAVDLFHAHANDSCEQKISSQHGFERNICLIAQFTSCGVISGQLGVHSPISSSSANKNSILARGIRSCFVRGLTYFACRPITASVLVFLPTSYFDENRIIL